MNSSLISIVVPCYNQGQYLSECLQSVLKQTYLNWECIIVNDGSHDNTEKISLEWCEKDNRFKYLKKENGGLSSARNAGIEMAKGEWILPLDADDYISYNYLEEAEKHFSDKNIKIIYCLAEKFGLEKGIWDLPDFSIQQLAYKNIIFCTALFKKNDWKSVGGYDERMVGGLEDWEFWINLIKKGGAVYRIPIICFYYRVKENSMVKDLNNNKREYLFKYLAKKHTDFFIQHIGTFHNLYYENKVLKRNYNKIYNSKRYKIGNAISFIKDFFISKKLK